MFARSDAGGSQNREPPLDQNLDLFHTDGLQNPGPDWWLVRTSVKSIDALPMDAGAGVPLNTIVGTLLPILQKRIPTFLRMTTGTPEWVADGSDHALNKQNCKLLTQIYIGAVTYELTLVGFETTSVTLSMLTGLLALRPDCERKMVAEIDAFRPRELLITTDDLEDKLPYVDMVIKQTMRNHTPTPVAAREASEDIEVDGYHLSKVVSRH
ncbi:hypothetical protein Mapa_005335 [Marchantia paleacea]|nr:hypothetical protein Mapa_005335 [Marchantia paleacea]